MPSLKPGEVIAKDFSFRHASRKRKALENVSFHVHPGQKVLVLGPSGAGKSTLLSAIMGLLDDDEGDATGTMRTGGVAGMVLQDPDSQVIASRVGDDVAFGCENLNFEREEIWRRVPPALQQVGLDLPLHHPTAELSGGQKQRLALAGVLAMGADVVLLDEPTANLDSQGVREVVDAVSKLHATCIVVEHRVDTWVEHVDTILVVTADGVVIGPMEQVLAEHGERLAAQGVWVPGIEPVLPAARPTPTPVEPAITATDLVVGWERPVAGPLNFHIPKGASTVITGANGAGKSTVLLTLAGLLDPQAGQVIAHGYTKAPHRWKSKDLASRFGYVFQDPEHQFVARSVEEELLVGIEQKTPQTAHYEQRAQEILRRLRLEHLAKANPFTLSGGQKRRLSVATCLVHTPSVVFLDEPTFGQDRTTFTELVHLVRELTDAGTTVVSITHDPAYLRALGDEVIAL